MSVRIFFPFSLPSIQTRRSTAVAWTTSCKLHSHVRPQSICSQHHRLLRSGFDLLRMLDWWKIDLKPSWSPTFRSTNNGSNPWGRPIVAASSLSRTKPATFCSVQIFSSNLACGDNSRTRWSNLWITSSLDQVHLSSLTLLIYLIPRELWILHWHVWPRRVPYFWKRRCVSYGMGHPLLYGVSCVWLDFAWSTEFALILRKVSEHQNYRISKEEYFQTKKTTIEFTIHDPFDGDYRYNNRPINLISTVSHSTALPWFTFVDSYCERILENSTEQSAAKCPHYFEQHDRISIETCTERIAAWNLVYGPAEWSGCLYLLRFWLRVTWTDGHRRFVWVFDLSHF